MIFKMLLTIITVTANEGWMLEASVRWKPSAKGASNWTEAGDGDQ